jgi:hypothetical protein
VKDLRSLTDPAAGSESPESMGILRSPVRLTRVEPMTTVSLNSVTTSADALSALNRLARQFDAQG